MARALIASLVVSWSLGLGAALAQPEAEVAALGSGLAFEAPSLAGTRARAYGEVGCLPLFVQGADDADPVAPNDVVQGQLADCYLLASLTAVAAQRPEWIRALVEPRGPGEFAVRLLGGRRVVHVDARALPLGPGGELAFARGGDAAPGTGHTECWPAVVELACASLAGGYAQLARGSLRAGLALVSPHPEPPTQRIRRRSSFTADELAALFAAAWAAGRPVVVGTRGAVPDGLEPGHAYALVGLRPGAVLLQDPWRGEPQVVDLATCATALETVCLAGGDDRWSLRESTSGRR